MLGRRLLDILDYAMRCRVGSRLAFDDLAATSEIGDWKMPDFKTLRLRSILGAG